MERSSLFAHINHARRESQSLEEHLSNTATIAKHFSEAFGYGENGYLIGLWHDIGKEKEAFQEHIINSNNILVDHSSVGALALAMENHWGEAECVAGHHSGLPDRGYPSDDCDKSTLFGRLKRTSIDTEAKSIISKYINYQHQIKALPSDPFSKSMITRILFSCLVDADYLDTENFMTGKKRGKNNDDIKQICLRALKTAQSFLNNPTNSEIGKKRNEILKKAIMAGDSPSGLFSLSAPTGSGKTFASLAFACKHILSHPEKRRIIYVIPYTSIIEQTADFLRGIIGFQNVLEHHCQVSFDYDDDCIPNHVIWKASENWDIPIVVTTNVQFFESLFSNKPSQCRKLHNISNSVVIFDEVQMLPINYLRLCLKALTSICDYCGVTAVLCSATIPNFSGIVDCKIHEILDNPSELYSKFRKNIIVDDSENAIDLQSLANQMIKQKKVLSVFNRKEDVRKIYAILPKEGTFFLTTDLTPSDRKKRIAIIKESLASPNAVCRVVSTSLIEAGVDLDFPVAFREINGIDSIVQTAGRCNREMSLPIDNCLVHVFNLGNNTRGDLSRKIALTNSLQTMDGYNAIIEYFDGYLNLLDDIGQLDSKGVVSLIQKEPYAFVKIASMVRIIDEDTVSIFVPNDDESKMLVKMIEEGTASRTVWRKAMLNCVSIYRNQLDSFVYSHKVEKIAEDFYVLLDLNMYDENGIGLMPFVNP